MNPLTGSDTKGQSVGAGSSDPLPPRALPDVAEDCQPSVGGVLERVGMSGVECLLRLPDGEGGSIRTPAKADAYVSLDDPQTKGVHMSRLYLELHRALDAHNLSPVLIDAAVRAFAASHLRISRGAELTLRFEHHLRRASLLSEHTGWRTYPIELSTSLRNEVWLRRLRVRVTYSSTCPCSAALSRQLVREKFESVFGAHKWVSVGHVAAWLATEEAMPAAPHSQRSHADVVVTLADDLLEYPFVDFIDRIEDSLGTAVQAAVKREDEQDFARRCGENLMFCEDAARRMKRALEEAPYAVDYRAQASHYESLHAHDAVAVTVKGVPGGLQA